MTDALTGRPRKIIEALYALSRDGPKLVTYEDIVVKAWELYPNDFGLRGYSNRFPDSSDIHVPLYKELKSKGWVATGPSRQKKFKLTPTGWKLAHSLFAEDQKLVETSGRMSRVTAEEIRHLAGAKATELYLQGRRDDVLDTDFFNFYRTSVRAGTRDFEGRLAQTKMAIDESFETRHEQAQVLRGIDEFLRRKFAEIISLKTSNR